MEPSKLNERIESGTKSSSEIQNGELVLDKMDLPEGMEEAIEKASDLGPSEQSSKKASQSWGGKAKKQLPKGDYVEIDGKIFTRQMLVTGIRKEIDVRINIIKRELVSSEGRFSKFSASEYQKKFNLLRMLSDFLRDFARNFKKMTIDKLHSTYELVVIQKGDPVV